MLFYFFFLFYVASNSLNIDVSFIFSGHFSSTVAYIGQTTCTTGLTVTFISSKKLTTFLLIKSQKVILIHFVLPEKHTSQHMKQFSN